MKRWNVVVVRHSPTNVSWVSTRFEHKNAHTGFRKPGGNRSPACTGAYNNIVKLGCIGRGRSLFGHSGNLASYFMISEFLQAEEHPQNV
jgi:hypothetical protein